MPPGHKQETQGEGRKALPLDQLTPEQEVDWKSSGGFNVRGSDGHLYRIVKIPQTNNVIGITQLYMYYPNAKHLTYDTAYNWLGCNPIPVAWEDVSEYRLLRMRLERFIEQKILLECVAPTFVFMSCSTTSHSTKQDKLYSQVGDYEGTI